MTDTTKSELDFVNEALREALERMKPELIAASDAAHRADDLASDDRADEARDRIMELGNIVEWLGELCTPHVRLLCDIAEMLGALHAPDTEEEGDPARAHRH